MTRWSSGFRGSHAETQSRKGFSAPLRLCVRARTTLPLLLLLGLFVLPVAMHAQATRLDTLLARAAAPVEQVCPTTLSLDELRRREGTLAARAASGSTDSLIALGCARARLYGMGSISRDGWRMPSGTSWQEGAIHAAMAALDDTPGSPEAADLLGAVALVDRRPKLHGEIATRLVSAHDLGSRGVSALRACGEVARLAGDIEGAVRCSRSAIAAATDAAWHQLNLTRIAYAQSDSLAAQRFFGEALDASADTAWYHLDWHLRWLLTPEEVEEWEQLADDARAAWIRDRLASRDIRNGRPSGSRLAEHFARLEHVDTAFRHRLVRRDLVRLRHGATPESELGREFIFKYWEPGLVPAEPFRFYAGAHPEYDDRAPIWMRFGPPTKRIPWTTRDWQDPKEPPKKVLATNVREVWTYEVDGLTLVLNFEAEKFDGNSEATRLVVGVLGSYLCDVDTWRCNLTMRAIGQGLNDEHITTLRETDREHLTQATTKDDHGVRAARSITMLARLHRVWDPASGVVLGVVPYAVRTQDVAERRDTTTAFALTVRQWDPGTGAWLEAAIPRALRLPRDRPSDGYLTGHAVVASGAGVSAWSVVAAQDTVAWGRAWADRTAPLGGGALTISDVILGAASQGQRWRTTGGTEVPLAPLGAFDRNEPVTLYWQVKSTTARDDLRTTVALYKTDGKSEEPALEIAFTGRVAAGLTEELREVGIGRLDGGRYRVEVVLTDPSDGATVRRSGELLVK
jgi:hypothetical protein